MFMGVFFPGKREFSAVWNFKPALAVILTLFLSVAAVCAGQDEHPLIVPRRTIPLGNQKPRGTEPRAIAVVQLNGGKGTLIPVAILINGRFFDASAYKADPVPMALESGTVYELEQGGDSQGLFTVNGALHSKVTGSAYPWVGTGNFLAPGKDMPKDTRKAEDVPIGLKDTDTGDAPPRLTRQESSKSGASGSEESSSPGGGSEKSGTASAPSASGGGRASSGGGSSSAGTPAPGSSGGSSRQDSSKPTTPSTSDKGDQSGKQQASTQTSPQASAGQTSGSKPPEKPSTGTSSGNGSDNNYYRPVLRRGKPTSEAPPDEQDNVVAKKIAETGTTNPSAATGTSGGRVLAAISDSAGPEPSSYKVFWKTGEEDERRGQMIALAQKEVRTYAAELVRDQIPAQPTKPKAAAVKGKASTKQAEPVLDNIQFRGFDLWLNNQPVLILTAEARIPGEAGSEGIPESYSVTVVARTDIYGDLQKLYSAVTDKFHLDVTPRLELVDVVDADGDGRGELLFQETTDVGKGYLIYRATADRLWKMFDSLNMKY
jgi:uncharacterized membrane protein YgcG